jgi:hypothetical protein
MPPKSFTKVNYPGMTIMTWRYAIISSGGDNLVKFNPAGFYPRIMKTSLKVPAASAATIIIRATGRHIYKIFFSHNGFYYKSKIFRKTFPKSFSYNLAWILDSKLDFKVFIPLA